MTNNKNRLAIDGGQPVRTIPLPPWPVFSESEITAAADILRSGKVNYWTGNQGELFEQEFASSVGCRYGVAVANGTVALELALYAAGIGPGDEVIVPCRTFIATASAVVMRGARPVFADIDPVSQNITQDTVGPHITEKTKAIIAVHLAGWPCDMVPLAKLAGDHKLLLIEDCAQAHGSSYNSKPVGSLGDVAAFSFCQDKIMTTGGEGGMLVTNNHHIWERAWSFKDHGKSLAARNQRNTTAHFRWLHDEFGTNWRLTEIQATIGRRQLRQLTDWVNTRRRNALFLNQQFSAVQALRTTIPADNEYHAYYKYYIFLKPEALLPSWNRDHILEAVNAEG
ncbi:MAG: DegT/DnrJ/EryC1/StrS aminotransferase family protein, partial [Deltaproteobacteria bacterium]|nr:DegT/DnrJ/EryC1/StrS aminotransferase family protein [Deltaproteobacteria bacterium]